MVNKQRVRRIKSLIFAFFVGLPILCIVLTVMVTVNMFALDSAVETMDSVIVQQSTGMVNELNIMDNSVRGEINSLRDDLRSIQEQITLLTAGGHIPVAQGYTHDVTDLPELLDLPEFGEDYVPQTVEEVLAFLGPNATPEEIAGALTELNERLASELESNVVGIAAELPMTPEEVMAMLGPNATPEQIVAALNELNERLVAEAESIYAAGSSTLDDILASIPGGHLLQPNSSAGSESTGSEETESGTTPPTTSEPPDPNAPELPPPVGGNVHPGTGDN